MSDMNDIAKKSLGDSTSYAVYSDSVDKSLLNPMPRDLARGEHDIMISAHGYDVWHCYEATFLGDDGVPMSGVLKIVVPHTSRFIIESKSLKLYLNTYDMVKFDNPVTYQDMIRDDLREALRDTRIDVTFFSYNEFESDTITSRYDLHETVTKNLKVDSYDGNYSIKESNTFIKGFPITHNIYLTSLRSRCRHTKQKDSGAVSITITSNRLVNTSDVIKYVYSLREVNEFHEFCAEKIYTELKKAYHGLISVHCFYVRRGGIDISPCRFDVFGYDTPVYEEFGNSNVLIKGFDGQ